MISVILPTSNELGLDYLPRILDRVCGVNGVEVIAVDNASTDGTAALLATSPVTLINAPETNRAQRLNRGIAAATGRRILLHHPRSLLDANALSELATCTAHWGAFTHAFDMRHPLLAWTSFYSNRIRLDRYGIAYLDHCIFADRDLLSGSAPVPELDIFEDTALSFRLRARADPVRLASVATTSAVRYASNGVWRQVITNQLMKLAYTGRLPNAWVNRIYERGLMLNGASATPPKPPR